MTLGMVPVLVLLLFLLSVAAIASDENKIPEWQDEQNLGVNKEAPHATLMPYKTLSQALKGKRLSSPYAKSLNGDWQFHWSPDPSGRPLGFYKTDYDASDWETIPVPSNWQVHGYGIPNYLCASFPIAVDPPNVMKTPPEKYNTFRERNDVGCYRTAFEVPASWDGRRLFINFNGVDSAFYLWINGRKVGFSVNSRVPAEFDITDYVKPGKNLLAAEVYRFSAATYLENQDMWMISGIFRNVTLWSAPNLHIRDFFVLPELDAEYRDAVVDASVKVKNYGKSASERTTCTVRMYDSADSPVEGACSELEIPSLAPGEERSIDLKFSVKQPLKWTAETPHLYKTVISLSDGKKAGEFVSCCTGFRKIEIKGNLFTINGVPVKLKGVNRHEHWPDTGHYVSESRMVEDLKLIKGCNCNHVRTSHYTNDPAWYELCDEYGVYLVAESNVECHGTLLNGESPGISHIPSWEKAFVDRVVAQVQVSKNHPSVVIWSLGNESGDGDNLRSALKALKAIDTSRPSHYEGFHDPKTNPCDMDSEMYTHPTRVEEIATENRAKPFYLCEYAHAMSNSMGAIGEYNDLFDKYPGLMGGAIWEWQDQALWNRRNPEQPFLAYGGDFGDFPTDSVFILKGVVFADRKKTPKYPEVKRVYQWVKFESADVLTGKVLIHNRYAFTNLNQFAGSWELLEDGKAIRTGNFRIDAAPGQSSNLDVPYGQIEAKRGSEYILRVWLALAEDELWAKAGTEVAVQDFMIPVRKAASTVSADSLPALVLSEKGKRVSIEATGFRVDFDKESGRISHLQYGSLSVLAKNGGPEFHPYRAPHLNDDLWAHPKWIEAGLNKPVDTDIKLDIVRVGPGIIKLTASCTTNADKIAGFKRKVTYTVYGDGSIAVDDAVEPFGEKIVVPRVADRLILQKSLNQFSFYGRGPMENYPDRKRGSDIGFYSSSVRDQLTPYVRPMECGNHEDVRWAAVTNKSGDGVMLIAESAPLSMSALPYTDEQLETAKHPHELTPSSGTVVCIGTRTLAVGSSGCGPKPLDQYITYSEPVSFSYVIRPVHGGDLQAQIRTVVSR